MKREKRVPCSTCNGRACEYGCRRCEYAYAGPDSHRICRACHGTGEEGI
jgi:hypothetical protein